MSYINFETVSEWFCLQISSEAKYFPFLSKALWSMINNCYIMWRYPLGPPIRQPFRTISLLGRWSTSGPDRGIAHFFTATRKTIEGVEEKNKRTKRTICLGLTQSARQGVMQHSAFPVCICRLTLAWISSETSTKLLGMPTYPDRSSSLLWTLTHANSSLCCRMSTALSVVHR